MPTTPTPLHIFIVTIPPSIKACILTADRAYLLLIGHTYCWLCILTADRWLAVIVPTHSADAVSVVAGQCDVNRVMIVPLHLDCIFTIPSRQEIEITDLCN